MQELSTEPFLGRVASRKVNKTAKTITVEVVIPYEKTPPVLEGDVLVYPAPRLFTPTEVGVS